MAFEQTESETAEDGEVFGCVVEPDATGIFAKGAIKGKEEYMLYTLVNPIASLVGVDPEKFIDPFVAGVMDGLRMIKANFRPEDIGRCKRGWA